jgi:hypothetical protein
MYIIKRIQLIPFALMTAWISGLMSLAAVFLIPAYASLLGGGYDITDIIGHGDYQIIFWLIGPIILGYIFGFLGGILTAVLYNLWAHLVGGIKIEIDQVAEPQPPQPPRSSLNVQQ